NKYKSLGKSFEFVCCILPTAPLISVKNIKNSYMKMINESFDTVFPVLEFTFPIQRGLKIEHDKIAMVDSRFLNTRSQDLPPRYHDAGQFYWSSVEVFRHQKKLLTDNSTAIIISQLEAQDIDNEIDWKLAEIKYKLINEISR
ncbi:MAG: pseudaminic acid cytidylyltransferase, partial [Ignavibacteriae bacterium]|nr:pseudaminic acid cytidylyltransferase [Ignavibacteriota bacterium]